MRAGAGVVASAYLARGESLASLAAAGAVRGPNTLPDPGRPAGTPTEALPFDHLVIVMMENHSFDNYLGMLPVRGHRSADGFTFDRSGRPVNSNPVKDGYVIVEHAPSHCQPGGPSQSWRGTHKEVNGGRMDGFAQEALASMLYWDQEDLPFYYSLATTFTLANRWFCSAPCQTYPNRRFLLAATAFGLISTDISSISQDPPNGTIVDRLDAHGITWKDYFTDLPATGVIESIPQKHPANLAHINQFQVDCAAGTLPSVSFVDSDIGAAGVVGGDVVGATHAPFSGQAGDQVSTQSQSEEGPADIALGENFVSMVANAVLSSPLWRRILLVWLYDEHGGYYDHVPPPAAIPPDSIPPRLGPNDPPGGYDIYGPRVPAVVMSAYSKPGAATNVVHDHTSILATIEAKWNLPAMTYRDANATTMADFLDPSRLAFPEPPALKAPYDVGQSEATCSLALPPFPVYRARPGPSGPGTSSGELITGLEHLVVRFYGRRHRPHGVLLALYTTEGVLTGLTIELLKGRRVAARAHAAHVGPARHRVVMRSVHHHGQLPKGHYTLVVTQGTQTLVKRRVRLGRTA